MLRQNNSPKGYAMVYSDDDGVTWSRPINVLSSGAVGKPTVIHLSSGRLFLVGRGTGGTYYSLSLDSGHNWSEWQKLGAGTNVYNSAVMLPTRELAVVYAYEADASARIAFQTFVDWRLDAAADLLPQDSPKSAR
jgi:Neuraminidase (sialidase)